MKLTFGAARVGEPRHCPEPGGWPEVDVTYTFYGRDSELPADARNLCAAAGAEMLRVTDLMLGEVTDEMVERVAEWFSRERYRSRVYDVDRDRARRVLAVAFQDKHEPQEGS